MKTVPFRALTVLFVLAWATLAQAATAVIEGPTEAPPGDLVILDASKSDAVSFAWALVPKGKSFLPVDGGKRVVFASGSAGTYTFVLATATADGQVALALHVLTVGKPLPPPIDPPDPPNPPEPPSTTRPTAVIYLYEKDQGGVPAPVSAALSKLNATGIRATTFEEDTVDGSGSVPDQYKIPLEAAQKAGLPALVVMAGDTVKSVVKAPTTEAQVMDAVQPPAGAAIIPIPALATVLAALNCGCQSGKRCTCHANGGHCDCAADMKRAKKLYPDTIVKPKKPKARRVASR